ncbi:MAG: Flp pilus assembly complex ATPase component TadA [Phycisphaerae bacterium]|nr:Flp pilus assembly complex ATPase component TadA [Phycisphaerae bacterium]
MDTSVIKERIRVGDILLAKGILTEDILAEALLQQEQSAQQVLIGEILMEMGVCTEDQIVEALAQACDLPFLKVNPKVADPKIVDLLPRDFLEQHNVLPLFKVRDELTVAVSEPTNFFVTEEIAHRLGCKVQAVVSPPSDIQTMLQGQLPSANVFVIDEIIEEVADEDLALIQQQAEDIVDLEQAATDSPVVKLVNYLLYNAVREGASDIHIEPTERALRVRYRVDGRLYEKVRVPGRMHPAVISRVKIMAGLDISERRLPQDGGIHVLLQNRPIDLRVSTMAGKYGEKAVIRIIDNQRVLMSIEKLGFSYETLREFRKQISTHGGIVLVTGPTGAGKTSTLYSALQELDSEQYNICTIEDPIEFNLPSVNQFQVNSKIKFDFAVAFRALLRQDPDIVMVGEIRDHSTATTAIQAALTGHLVLSTLHTIDAPSAVTRLINIGIEPYLIAAALNAVLAQRLVRKICPNCKEQHEPPENIKGVLESLGEKLPNIYGGKGCSKCRHSGFSGRIGIFELLVPNSEMRDMIARNVPLSELRQAALQQNMVTLRQDGLAKVKNGIASIEEVLSVTSD